MTVRVITTGGTISSHWDGATWSNIGGVALLNEIAAGGLAADVSVVDVAAGPSSSLTLAAMLSIANGVADSLDEAGRRGDPHGAVVVHGTDTIELTAFAAQLVLGTDPIRRPAVFTGSMRVHSHHAPDGPGNVRDAVAVAAAGTAVGRDVVVCMGGALHAADRVCKRDAASLDAFTSAPLQPVGSVEGGDVVFASPAGMRPALGRVDVSLLEPVPLVTCVPGIEAGDVERAIGGARAAVVEGFGDLNLPSEVWRPVHDAAMRGCAIIVASGAFTPSISTETLDALGAIGSGGLSAQKARLAAAAALAAGCDRAGIAALLGAYALHRDAGERGTA